MEIQFDPSLDKLASFIRRVLPSGNGLSEVLRLQVDYKDPGGVARNMDMLVNVPTSMTTAQLIAVVRESLHPGSTLSAIGSLDCGRPIYIAPGFLEECMAEQGLPIPTNVNTAMDSCGLRLLSLEEIRQIRKEKQTHEQEL
ncbi:MAG: hypothetical protein OSJ58_11295 [Dysosmobacter sp.]|nr:hypothetical protein [Dysosmobacter sp.]